MSFIENCPTSPQTEPASLSLNLSSSDLPSNYTNLVFTATVNGSSTPISGNSLSLTNLTQGNYSVAVTRCYDTVETGDKRTDLLASADRIGYGANTTGGTNYVFPSNEAELRQMAAVDGNYVCLDNLNGEIGLTSGIYTGSNITIDGSNTSVTLFPDYANGFPSSASGNSSQALINSSSEDNVILHCFKLDGKRNPSYVSTDSSYNTGGLNIRSTNVWIDHVEITEFWDDAISTAQQGDFLTFSNLKITNTDKGILLYYNTSSDPRHITVFNSYLAAAQRNPWNTGASNLDTYNNLIRDSQYGAFTVGRLTSQGAFSWSGEIHTIGENNVFINNFAGSSPISYRGYDTSVIVEGFIYDSGSDLGGDPTVGNYTTASAPWAPPYTRDVMPSGEVEAYVLANSGAITKEPTAAAEDICETETCVFTVEVEDLNNPPTGNLLGCNSEYNYGDMVSIKAELPTDDTSWQAGSAFWGDNATFNGQAFDWSPYQCDGPLALSLCDLPIGSYCLNFSATSLPSSTLVNSQCCFDVKSEFTHDNCPDADVEVGTPVTLTVPSVSGATYIKTIGTYTDPDTSSPDFTIANATVGVKTVTTTVCVDDHDSTVTVGCPCEDTTCTWAEFDTGALHQYGSQTVFNADSTLVLQNSSTNIVSDITGTIDYGWPGVSGSASWSPTDPTLLWGTRSSVGTFHKVDWSDPNNPINTTIYTAPTGTTFMQMGSGQGRVENDSCVALNITNNGVDYIVTLDVTTNPATVLAGEDANGNLNFPAPTNYKWVRFSKDCSKVLIYDAIPNDNSYATTLEVYDPTLTTILGTLAQSNSHSDFITMPDGSEWLLSAGSPHRAENISDPNGVHSLGDSIDISTVHNGWGHWSALGSANCPGLAMWGPSQSGEDTARLYSFNDDFTVNWSKELTGFDHGILDAYLDQSHASISYDGGYIMLRANDGSGSMDYLVTLDNSACPDSVVSGETCTTYTCQYTVVEALEKEICAVTHEFTIINGEVVIQFTNTGSEDAQVTIVEGTVVDDASQNISDGVFTIESGDVVNIPRTYPLCYTTSC